MNSQNMKYLKLVGTWSLIIGMVLAVATVFVEFGDWVSQVLIILGLLAGLLHDKLRNEIVSLGVIYLSLSAVAGSAGELAAIGPYISDIAAAWVGFLGPVVLMVTILWGGAFLMVNEESEGNLEAAKTD